MAEIDLEQELAIRAKGGHEGVRELEIMCAKAAEALASAHKRIEELALDRDALASKLTVEREHSATLTRKQREAAAYTSDLEKELSAKKKRIKELREQRDEAREALEAVCRVRR